MKKLLLSIALLISLSSMGQNAVKDVSGNYVAVSKVKDSTRSQNKDTGKTFTDKDGNVYKVFESAKGKLFYVRVSKTTGNPYKVYINVEG